MAPKGGREPKFPFPPLDSPHPSFALVLCFSLFAVKRESAGGKKIAQPGLGNRGNKVLARSFGLGMGEYMCQ